MFLIMYTSVCWTPWNRVRLLSNYNFKLNFVLLYDNLHWNEQGYESQHINHLFIVVSHLVAFMQFSQSAYSQDENISSLSVSLVLDPFGGSGSGSAAITQDIVGQITAFAQAGDNATGEELMRY